MSRLMFGLSLVLSLLASLSLSFSLSISRWLLGIIKAICQLFARSLVHDEASLIRSLSTSRQKLVSI